ncbi:hypothetical protein [Streptomyces sp. NPDC006552]|uniref:hypothetical protein n=1 Tax=Streptomyces sp. NPDC006552 TaxID=3157179 RepID=UPI0033AA3558
MATNDKKSSQHKSLTERTEDELAIESFDEVDTPEADIVSLGDASYTKMLGKIYS